MNRLLSVDNRMAELNLNKLRTAFKIYNLTERDYINPEDLILLLTKLNDQDFDEETFEELWDQCTLNSKGEARIADFMAFLMQAEEILLAKLRTVELDIAKLEVDKKNKASQFGELRKIKEGLEQSGNERQAVLNSLEIIRKPFLKPAPLASAAPVPGQTADSIPAEEHMIEYDSKETPDTLVSILQLCAVSIVFNLVGGLLFNRFLDMTADLLVVGCFLMGSVNRLTIRFCCSAVCLSCLLGVFWLLLEMDSVWGAEGEWARGEETLLRVSVGIAFCEVVVRLVMAYLLFSQFQLDESQVYAVKTMGLELLIQKEADPALPIISPIYFPLREWQKSRQTQ